MEVYGQMSDWSGNKTRKHTEPILSETGLLSQMEEFVLMCKKRREALMAYGFREL